MFGVVPHAVRHQKLLRSAASQDYEGENAYYAIWNIFDEDMQNVVIYTQLPKGATVKTVW